MIPQERRFPLAEAHTSIGSTCVVQLDQGLLAVLGVTPGDGIIFQVDEQGSVTVRGEKKAREGGQLQPGTFQPGEIVQAPLFGDTPPKPISSARRGSS